MTRFMLKDVRLFISLVIRRQTCVLFKFKLLDARFAEKLERCLKNLLSNRSLLFSNFRLLFTMRGKTGVCELINWSKFLSLIQEANCSDFIINYEEWMFNGTEMTRISATVDATLSYLGEELSSCYYLNDKIINLSV